MQPPKGKLKLSFFQLMAEAGAVRTFRISTAPESKWGTPWLYVKARGGKVRDCALSRLQAYIRAGYCKPIGGGQYRISPAIKPFISARAPCLTSPRSQ